LIEKHLIEIERNLFFSNKFIFQSFTSAGEANVKTISAADPDAGAAAADVA
jgi:hypothetical protein